MNEQDLRDLVPEELDGRLLRILEAQIDLLEIGKLDPFRDVLVSGQALIAEHAGKRVVRVIDGHGCDAVAAPSQKINDGLVDFLVRARMEKRVAEPFELSPAPFHQRAHDYISPDHVVFVLPERNLVETRMRVRVVGEVEAGVEPLLEHHGTGVALARNVQLPLVDEDRRRDFLSGERSDQTVRDALKTFQVSHLADHRPIVYGYGHAARGRRRRSGGLEQRQHQGDRQSDVPHGAALSPECRRC